MSEIILPWQVNFLDEINACRAGSDLIPLLRDPRLMVAAQAHADHLISPACPWLWGSGEIYRGWDAQVSAADYPSGTVLGISIAVDAASPKGAVGKFIANLPDRSALLNRGYIAVGLGNAQAKDGTHWWVAIYGGMFLTA